MKLISLIVLSCLCICFANAAKITTWGNVNGRQLDTKNVALGSIPLTVITFTFTYPHVIYLQFEQSVFFWNFHDIYSFFKGIGSVPIHGIKHIDYKQNPVEVHFIKGDIGDRNVTIKLKSQRGHGINSSFTFYTN